jgi:hypothetical protein
MAKMGRPSKFNRNLSLKVAALYAAGKTDREVANEIGVSIATLYNWKNQQPDFLESLKVGQDVADQLVEQSLFQLATGFKHPDEQIFCAFGKVTRVKTIKRYPPNATAAIFWLKNRKPDMWREQNPLDHGKHASEKPEATFTEFCVTSGYPPPFEKQIKMMEFGINGTKPRMLLGARGYGKTDYITVLGVAYDIYMHGVATTNLIISKSKTRNTAMVQEIAEALKKNGVELDKENSSCIRVKGLVGKDHSVEAITIKTSMRGRHPKRVIMDDPVTEEDVSEAMRLLVKRKYNEVLKLCDNVCVIGQPAHAYDLYSELRPTLEKMEVQHGTIVQLDHDLTAQRLAGVDESSIQASYFLKIIPDGQLPFQDLKFLDQFPTTGTAVAFIDPSFEGGDYTALSILKAYGEGIAVVGFAWKKAWNHCLDGFYEKLTKYNVKRLCFETNSLGDQPIDILRGVFKSTGIGVVGRKTTGNKHARILSAGKFSHMIHLSKESDRVYIEQVQKYEYRAKNDDCPDSLASCLEWIGLIRGNT